MNAIPPPDPQQPEKKGAVRVPPGGSNNMGPKSLCRFMVEHSGSWFKRVGCAISACVADIAAHPFAQILVIAFCALWWILDLPTDILTAALSILAITLTQMVLNKQGEREVDAHRRDVAMHAKLDELVVAAKGARNEMAGIERLEEEEIEHLKDEVVVAVDKSGHAAHDEGARMTAKRAAIAAVEETHRSRQSKRSMG